MDSKKNFFNDYKNPPVEYRPQYFWFLNHDMQINEMKKQLDLIKKNGGGGAFLHARHGRITPYLSEKWLEICSEAIDYGNKIGLQVWLYDEDGFPSGFCKGKTIEPNPKDFSANFIVLNNEFEVEAGEKLNVTINLEHSTSEIYGILAIPVKETDLNYEIIDYPKSCLDITDCAIEKAQHKFILEWIAPESHSLWLVCPFIREWNTRAANVLSMKAMQRFIDITHQKYYEYFRKRNIENLMGNTIPGIFTDEPGVQYCIGDKSWRRIIVFTPEMEQDYLKRYDMPLLFGLPSVFYEVKENINYRLNFWEMAADLYSKAYFRQIYDWCEKHNIWATGHLANDSNLFNQVRDQIDFFKAAKYFHLGPSDQLGTVFRAQFEKSYSLAETDNMMTPRFAGSSARLYNQPRVISECFGSSGWQISLERQKILVDWQIANGVNLFIPHDFSYSIAGPRKRDHPPAFERSSYFDEISVLNDYIGRLCYIFSQSENSKSPRPLRIGLVYGNRTILADMNPMKGNDAAMAHDAQAYIIDILQRLHYDFDILPEEVIIESKIEDKHLVYGKNEYDMLVFAALRTIKSKLYHKIINFYEKGGKILFIQKIPDKFYSSRNHPILSQNHKQTSNPFLDIISISKEKDSDMNSHQNDKDGIISFLKAQTYPIYKNNLLPIVNNILRKTREPNISIVLNKTEKEIGDIAVRQLQFNEGKNEAIFLANVSKNIYRQCRVKIHPIKSIQNQQDIDFFILDAVDGTISKIKPLKEYQMKDGVIVLILDFLAVQSYLFLIDYREDNKQDQSLFEDSDDIEEIENLTAINPYIPPNLELINEINEWNIYPTRLNILNLDKWKVNFSVEKMGIERPSYLVAKIKHLIEIE
ncbi:MAG: hypothetical protein GF364_04525, partial [Candidatus Lokiarchaeota archaeon]|nr:hypothetical protein [Candidatus Lokiarchaeota archaeon]